MVTGGHWYVIAENALAAALERAAAGDDPTIILAEIFANSAPDRLEGEAS